MRTSLRFSTNGIPPARRLDRWHETIYRVLARRDLSPADSGPFAATATIYRLGPLGPPAVACVLRASLTTDATASRLRPHLADGNDDVILHIQETGQREVSQIGREALVSPGCAVLVSNADPSRHRLRGPTKFATLALPRKLMLALIPDLEDAFVRPMPANAGALRLLAGYLDVVDDDAVARTPGLARAVATHLQDLCALAIGAPGDGRAVARERGVRAARLRAVKADVLGRLAEGDVSAAGLALRQGVTPRYIHKLFENEGTTLSRFVRRARLVQVHRQLSDSRREHRTISELAYAAGFGDLSSFNREFRRQFGATPSDIRAAARDEPKKV